MVDELQHTVATAKLPDDLPIIALQRSPCMFTNTGIARYVNELQKALAMLDTPLQPFQRFPDMYLSKSGLKRKYFALIDAWYDAVAQPLRIDTCSRGTLVHYTSPPARTAGICSVTTCHDLNPLNQKADFGLLNRLLFRKRLHALADTDFVITISDYVRGQLISLMPELSSKCRTIHLGLTIPENSTDRNQSKDPDMLLMAGRMTPNKNFNTAITAFAGFRKKHRANARLHIVGPLDNTAYLSRIKQQCRDLALEDSVVIKGQITDKELWQHYARATYFLFPSLQEGFGLPVLEAQRAGCCCISSNATSLPEIGGDGCLYISPLDDAGIFKALEDLETSSDLRKNITYLGMENARKFTWNNCARETVAVYREAWERHASSGQTKNR